MGLMAYNNKKVGAICGCHITFCVKTSKFDSLNFEYLEIFGFIRIDFMFFKCGFLRNLFSIPQRKVFSSLGIIHKKLLGQKLLYITNDEKSPLISWSVYRQ